MHSYKNFSLNSSALRQDLEVYGKKQTLVIDIENTLVTKIPVMNEQEIKELRNNSNYQKEYIELKGDDSQIQVYKVRPYTYDFLRAIQPFYEIIIHSLMDRKVIENISNHLESVLNSNMKTTLYFQFILHNKQYVYLKELDEYVEILPLLAKNRYRDNIILLSSKPVSIINAFNQGFNSIPIIPFDVSSNNDFQLNLIENYIMRNN